MKTWALAVAVPLLAVGMACAQDQPGYGDQQNAPDPPARAARLSYLRGNVSLEPNGAPDWSQAAANYPMSSGDRLYTDQDSRAELQVGNSVVRLDALTDLTVTDLTDNFLQLGLASGTMHLRTFGLNPGDSQEIDTPNGAVLISQPGDIRISSDPNTGTTVEVFSGAVQLSGPDLNQSIYAGTTVELSGTNPIYVAQVDFPGEDGFDTWSANRDQRLTNSVSAQYVSRQMPGYDDLDQYGDWDPNAAQYGPVWYPRDVPAGWAPYSQGYWAQVGPWGWTWVDTTGPWGYAPFHYGRWALVGERWGWLPGPVAEVPVYSPALVAFAGGGGFSIGIGFGGGGGIAAWFPLGPRDPFIPWYHASPRYVTNVNITNVTVVNRVYVNNVVNNYNVNHTEINNYHYTNVSHVVAVPANNFGGHQVRGSEVKLTPQQVQNIRPVVGVGQVPVREPARPAGGDRAAGGYRPVGLQPAARPVAAPAARPSVITPRGVSTTQAGAVARPVPKGLASVNSTRPAMAPRPGAVTGNKPMPASATPLKPMPQAASRPMPVAPSQPARPAVERPAQPAVNPQQQRDLQLQQQTQQMEQQKQQQEQQKQQQDQKQQQMEQMEQQKQQQQQMQQQKEQGAQQEKQRQDQLREQQDQQKQQQMQQQKAQQDQQKQQLQQEKQQQQLQQQEQERQRQQQLKDQQQKPAPPVKAAPVKPQKPVKPPPPVKKDDDPR